MQLLGGSLEKPSKEDKEEVSLEEALVVSAAPAAARHRTMAGPSPGFPTKKKSLREKTQLVQNGRKKKKK